MHIPDGILPAGICVAGYATTCAATWYSLQKIKRDKNPQAEIPKASLLTAAFFVASWIHLPLPPASVHLILNGLLGTVLGYYAFPAILIGLFFQAVMFGHGGLTTLGVNATMMGIPALLAYQIFQLRFMLGRRVGEFVTSAFAFVAGAVGLGMAAIVFFFLVISTIDGGTNAQTEINAIYALTLAHIPLMVIEGAFTAMLVAFLKRVKPELIRGQR
jgi:cobalt/nickel transport system permease protein